MLFVTEPPPAPDHLAVLSLYQGGWKTRIDDAASEFGPASHSEVDLKNDCWRFSRFFACQQTVDGKPGGLVVFAWDDTAKVYRSWPIGAGADPVHPGVMQIDGDTWIFPWEQPVDGKSMRLRVVNRFIDHNTIEYRKEVWRDAQGWTAIGRGVETRTGR